MLRATFITATALTSAALIVPTAAAHPEPANKAVTQTAKKPVKIDDIKLPSQSDIDTMVKNMPDMNAIMGQMMTVMKDPELRKNMERSGKAFADKLDSSGAMAPTGKDGMPDFNKAFGAMLSLMSDENAMGGMLETLGTMAEGMEGIEQHISEQPKTPKTD